MKIKRFFCVTGALCLSVIILLAVMIIRAEACQAYTHTALTDSVDAMFAQWDKEDTPGTAVGIFKDGRIIYARGYGMANLEYDIPITPQTVFRIGSVSKQFTAMCIALLAEQGKLSLDDDIRKFFLEMPVYETPITVGHLVHHTSGIRDYFTLQGLVTGGEYYNSQDALAMLLRQKGLNFTPGERFSYANSGYFLLAALVERASGMKTSEFARRYIFEPLGMNDTHFHDDINMIVRNRASGYRPVGEEGGFRINMTQLDIIGDGSVYTTIEDFFKWDQNFYNNKLGNGTRDLIDMVLTLGILNDGTEITYAFGLDVETYRGLSRVSHSGSFVGFNAYYLQFPDQRFSVVIFTNNSMGPGRFAGRIAELYLADQFAGPAPERQERPARQRPQEERPESVTLSTSQLQEYVGTFYSDELDAYAVLRIKDGNLTIKLGINSGGLTAFPSENFEWRRRRIEFIRDSRRNISGFVLQAGRNLSLEFTKVK